MSKLPADFDSWQKYQRENKGKIHTKSEDRSITVRNAIGAALNVEYITKHERWDRFLGLLQASLDLAEEARETYADMLMRPETADSDVPGMRRVAARLEGQIVALKWVLGLPKELIENGKVARELRVQMANETETE